MPPISPILAGLVAGVVVLISGLVPTIWAWHLERDNARLRRLLNKSIRARQELEQDLEEATSTWNDDRLKTMKWKWGGH